jgi:hypothetical protein
VNDLFFHIGFHKTGSTWLQKNLFSNIEYFNLLNNYAEPWTDVLISYLIQTNINEFDSLHFRNLVLKNYKTNKINIVSAERISGHPFSGGYDSLSLAKKIKKSFPDAKIIIVKREINSFKLSCYKQQISRGYPGTFSQFFKNNWILPPKSEFYFDHKNITDIYKSQFTNVLELEFEKFINDKTNFLNLLFTFLKINIETSFFLKQPIANKTKTNRRLRSIRFFNKFNRSEYNDFPILTLNSKLLNLLSFSMSFLFSNREFFKKN